MWYNEVHERGVQMDTIGTLLYKVDLSELARRYTTLHLSNGIYRGACPIHGGHNETSFCIINNRYYCHSCGATGNAINLYSEKEGLPFYQAVEQLCEEFEVSLDDADYKKQRDIFKKNAQSAAHYMKQVDVVRDYLKDKRSLTDESITEFQLGYDSGGFLGGQSAGIVIPIQDNYGRIVGFSKRKLANAKDPSDPEYTKDPKYRNTKEDDVFHKRQVLFNYHRAIKLIKKSKTLHVTEGYLDVISAHQQGIACVGYLGGSLTKDQIKLLWELQQLHRGDITFILAMDNPEVDETGRRMLVKMRDSILKYAPELNVRVVKYPKETE